MGAQPKRPIWKSGFKGGVSLREAFSSAWFWLAFLTFVCLLLPSLTLAASSGLMDSAWPAFGGNSKHTGLSPYDTSKIDGTIKWTWQAEGMVQSSPVLASDGTIYIADGECNLYALTTEGKEKWKFSGGEPVHSTEWEGYHCNQSTPAVAADGTVYFYPMTGNFYAINPDGTEKWKFPMFTFTNIWPSPTIATDGTIYVSSEFYPPRETGKKQEKQARFYALNPDGTKKWEHGGEYGGGSIAPVTLADDGTIYIATGETSTTGTIQKLFALNPDGTEKWKFWPQNGVLEGGVTIGSDGTLYFGAKGMDDPRNARFYALNPDSTEKWHKDFNQGISITPGIDKDQNLYFGDWGGTFYSLDKNGNERWRVQTPNAYESLSSSPAIGADGTLYFGTIAKEFYAYTTDGKLKWKLSIPEGGVNVSPAIGKDGTVYFASVPGKVYAIGGSGSGAQSGAQVSTSENQSTSKLLKILSVTAGVIFLAFLTLGWFVESRRKIFWIISAVLLAGGAVLIIFSVIHPESESTSKPNNTSTQTQTQPQTNDSKNSGQSSQTSTNNDSDTCPHHVYGKSATNFYGAFGMETRDLTDSEVTWIRANCPNATWPENTQ